MKKCFGNNKFDMEFQSVKNAGEFFMAGKNHIDEIECGNKKKMLPVELHLAVAKSSEQAAGGKSQKIFNTNSKIVLEIILEIDNIM
jgi:hypothetical protein